MDILERYLAKHILKSIGFTLLLLVALQAFILYVGELVHIGKGNYDLMAAFMYVLFRLPYQLYDFFPMAALIGSLLGLGALATTSELTVMRAAGMSVGRIAWVVVKVACVLLLLVTFIGEGLGPQSIHFAEQRKAMAMSKGQAIQTISGVWARIGHNYLHINAILPGERLQGVTRYAFNDKRQLLYSAYAESARYHDGHWNLQHVKVSYIGDKRVRTEQLPTAIWNLPVKPSLLALTQIKPRELTLWQLHHYVETEQRNREQVGNFALSFWQRVMQPLATLVMMLLAIPFIFGSLRSATMGSRLLVGVLMGFSFYILNEFFGPISVVWQLPPALAALIPSLLFSLLAVVMLKRVR
jgi:lipopolysaccharide export system permease protein